MHADFKIMQLPYHQSFVSPYIVRLLVLAGLDAHNTPYFWKGDSHKMQLHTYTFDDMRYYRDADAIINAYNPPLEVLPGYQLGDMEKLLPDYFMERVNQHYSIAIDQHYRVESVTDKRQADAFAIMVLDCIKAGIIVPELATKTLQS